MALAGMLSAVRELILEIDDLPDDLGERRRMYAERFGSLSPDEVGDLAKIPPAQIRSYTRFALHADASALQVHFPLSFVLLARQWPLLAQSEFQLDDFMRGLLRRYPWKSYQTLDLGGSLLNFLEERFKDQPQAELIFDCVRVELEMLRIKRDPLGLPPEERRLDLSDLSALSVEQFLGLSFLRNPQLGFVKCGIDIEALHRDFDETDKSLPLEIVPNESWIVVARSARNQTRPTAVSEEIFDLIRSSKTTVSCESLVECFIESNVVSEKGEQAVFQAFMEECLRLTERGIVYLPKH